MFDHDAFSSAPVSQAARASMAVINAVQQLDPAVQVHGMAAAFLLLAERFKLEPQDLFAKTTNLMNYAEGRRPEFTAVSEYLAGEI